MIPWTVWWSSHRPGSVSRVGDRGLPRTSCSQASYYSKVKIHLTPARPHPSPGRRSTRRASGSSGSDRGAWGDPLVTSAASRPAGNQPQHGRAGGGRARRQTLADRDLQVLQRPGTGGQSPRRGRVVPGAVGACDRAVWTRSRRSRRWSAPAFPPPRRRCPPATSARSSDSPGPVEGVADDRLGGGAAGLSTPQEGKPVKRSCTAVRPPVPRVAGQLAAVDDRGLLGAVNVLVRVHMVGAGGVEPPSSSAPANTGNRCADGPFCRSCSTVGTEVKCSHRVQLSALPTRSERH
jgi:hypothetical protein